MINETYKVERRDERFHYKLWLKMAKSGFRVFYTKFQICISISENEKNVNLKLIAR